MPRLKHKHSWLLRTHIDGCHFYSSVYHCDCGHSLGLHDERDPREDPYSVVWMEPAYETVTRDAKGRFIKPEVREVICERCRELQAGAEAQHAKELYR